MVNCAITLIAHHESGRVCDPHAVRWARHLIENNPHLVDPIRAKQIELERQYAGLPAPSGSTG
jgi:hypothetical protein